MFCIKEASGTIRVSGVSWLAPSYCSIGVQFSIDLG